MKSKGGTARVMAHAMARMNTDYAALEISVNSRIVSPFSRQMANGNAGPTTA